MSKQQTDTPEDCLGMGLNGQPLEIVETFCYLGDTVGARMGANDIVTTRISKGCISLEIESLC